MATRNEKWGEGMNATPAFLAGMVLAVLSAFSCAGQVANLSGVVVRIHGYAVDTNLMGKVSSFSNASDRVAYLVSVVTNGAGTKAEIARRRSAMLLLGQMRDPRGLQALIDNIDFVDPAGNVYPALYAIPNFGEEALAPLLHLIEETDKPRKQYAAVQSIVAITRDRFNEFYDSNKNSISAKARKALLFYSINE